MAPRPKPPPKPKFIGYGGFEYKLIGVDGARKFMDMVAKEPEKLQNIRSMYVGVAVEGLDEFADDMLASALNIMSPGNMPHNLEKFKLFIAGTNYMEMHTKSVSSPAASCDAPLLAMLFDYNPPASLLESKGVVFYQAERAFIRALLNIRGVQRVEVDGPMPVELKKRIGACLTTRPGFKVRNWKGEQSGFRTEQEISLGPWIASMHIRDDPLDDTVGPDGVELVDTVTLHHELDVSYTVELPVPDSPSPDQDKTIWNKPPFRYPSPEFDGTNFNAASIRHVEVPEERRSSSPPNLADEKDDDFNPYARSRKRRRTTQAAEIPRKRHCTRSTTKLYGAALDYYDAKLAIGFPSSPPGKLVRVNYSEPVIEEDFGKGNGADPSKHMSWDRGDRQKQKERILPTSKAAKISVATKVDKDGRRLMRETRKKQNALEAIPEEEVEDDDELKSDSEREDDTSKAPDGTSPVQTEAEDGEEAQGPDVDMGEYGDEPPEPPSSSPRVNDKDDGDYDDGKGL